MVQTNSKITVEVIDTLDGLRNLKAEWEYLFLMDPDANVFLSWSWMMETCRDNQFRWSILTARRRNDQTLLGILPLKLRVHWSRSRQRFQTEIEAGGRLSHSAYSGIICDPTAEDEVLAALAGKLVSMPWTKLALLYFSPETRAEKFGDFLETADLKVKWKGYRTDGGTFDKLTTACIPLPGTFEQFLTTQKDREIFRDYLSWRRGDGSRFQIRILGGSSLPQILPQVQKFLEQHCDPSEHARFQRYFPNLKTAARVNRLFMPVISLNGQILAFSAHVYDSFLGEMLRVLSINSLHEKSEIASRFLTLFVIEKSIEKEFLIYDFGREALVNTKEFVFERNSSKYLVVDRTDLDDSSCLDILNLTSVIGRIASFIEKGQTKEALAGCNQIKSIMCDVSPNGTA